MHQNQQQVSSDQLFLQIFGTEEELKEVRRESKSFATYSQLMTLAHHFNRPVGRATKGCNCNSCNAKRKSA